MSVTDLAMRAVDALNLRVRPCRTKDISVAGAYPTLGPCVRSILTLSLHAG